MKAIWIIISKNLKHQLKSPIFWLILIAFPIAQLTIFSSLFSTAQVVEQTVVKLTQLYATDTVFTFDRFAIIVLGQFFLIGSIIASSYLVSEREDRTLMRTFTLPLTKAQIFSGHMLSLIMLLLLVITIIMIMGSLLFNVQWSANYLNLFIVTVLCAFLSSSFGFFISSVFKNGNMFGGIMSCTVILMSFLNGDMTSGKLLFRNSDFLTLNKWITSSYTGLNQGLGLRELALDITVIGALGLIFAGAAIALFRKENLHE